MRRSPYRERILPQWLEDSIAVGGLLLTIVTFFALAVYGYVATAPVLP